MQTTLLGLAITVILALVTALVGPLFVDWGRYRPQFEAEASRLVGLPVRVRGTIDVRLLPSPSLIMSGIEIGQAGSDGALKARALGVEFALGPLMRGQLRAAQTRVIGPEFTLGLDGAGRLVFPKAELGTSLDNLSIDRLNIDEARVVLADAASGTRAALDKFWFHGEVRSLAGAFKGEGAFVLNGDLYGYRIAASRLDDSGVKIKFSVDPADRPLSAEGEGTFVLDKGAPSFDGTLTLTRAVGAVLAGGHAVMSEPLRISSRMKATPASALFEQIEFQYGPDERALKLGGTADLKLGARPRLDGVLSARQLDLDRLMASADTPRRLPFAAIKTLLANATGAGKLPIPARIGIGIENVILSGATLQSVRGDLHADASGWSLDKFEFRAPGQTQLQLGGKIDAAAGFSGPVDVTAADPRALLGWLTGRTDAATAAIKPMKARGDVTIGGETIAVDRLRAEIDRKSLEGRLAYSFPTGQRKARLEAELRAPDFDADAMMDLSNAVLGATRLERPGELSLSLDLGRATFAGFEAKNAAAKLNFDTNGLQIERLAVADFGGAALAGSGQIDTSGAAPRGSLALDIDARNWSGINALVAKFTPQSAERVQRLSARLGPAKLHTSLDVGKEADNQARIAIQGNVGAIQVDLRAQGQGDMKSLLSSRLRVDGTLSAEDGGALVRSLGLDGIVPQAPGAGEFKLLLDGPADGELALSLRLRSGDFSAESHGTARVSLERGVTASLSLQSSKGDAQRGLPLPFTLQSKVAVAGYALTFDDIVASIERTRVRGRIEVVAASPLVVSGKIESDAADLPYLIGWVAGSPQRRDDNSWSPDPFITRSMPDVSGRIAFRSARVSLVSGLMAQDFNAALRFAPSELSLDDVSGKLAGGSLAGALTLRRRTDGLNVQGRLALSGVDASSALSGDGNAIAGRLGLQIEMEGTGMSPRALIGSLTGSGTVTLENAQLAKLDPHAFAATMRAVDQGLPLDAAKIRDTVAFALDAGRLNVKQAEGVVTMTGGQVRLGTVITRAEGAELAVSGNLDLADETIDAKMTLTATNTVALAGRPEVTIALKGPAAAPRRTLDVAALAGWLALRAVEQQAKRLEAIEAERSGRATTQSVPAVVGPPIIAIPAPRPASAPKGAEASAAATGHAAPLPAPMEIKPAPKPKAIPPTARDQFMNQIGSQR